jgi:hypothetical protein
VCATCWKVRSERPATGCASPASCDTATGAHIWADRFDGALDDIFELQDQVASSVAGAIEPKLMAAEIERAARKPTANLDAYDLNLRARARVHLGRLDEARAELGRLLAIDPNLTIAALGAVAVAAAPEFVELYFAGLRLAGLPEG